MPSLLVIAKFSHNPTMKQHRLSTGTIFFAETSPFDLMWVIGLWVDDPEAHNPSRWPGKNLLGKALSTVRDAIRTSEAGLATHASSQQLCTSTSPGGIQEMPPAPPRPTALARACPGPPSEFSPCFSEAPRGLGCHAWGRPLPRATRTWPLTSRWYHYSRRRPFHHEDRGSQRS